MLFVSLVVNLFLCAGCASDRLASSKSAAPPVDPATQMPALEERIFDIVQDERHRLNPAAKPLVLDSELMTVARKHSADMAEKKYVAHRGPDGQTSASLIMAADQDFQGLLGENLAAQRFVLQSGVDVDFFAKRFVDTWLASPQNRDNLSFPNYNRGAVGAAVSGDTIYVTELFATDLGLAPPARNPKNREISEWKDPGSAPAPGAPKQTERAANSVSESPSP